MSTSIIRSSMLRPGLAVTLCALLAPSNARAQHAGDIVLDISASAIRTNQFDQNSVLTPGVRVFKATLGVLDVNFTDSPGFDSLPSTFPVPSKNGFRIRKALKVWNGSAFIPIAGANPETMEIAYASLGPTATPPCDTLTSGFEISIGSNGQWHRHLEYTLTGQVRTGIYLLELEIYSTSASIAQSKPFWLVFYQLNDNDFVTDPATLGAGQDAGVQWVNAHLVPRKCPADFNASGQVSVQDLFDFLKAYFAHDSTSDFNGTCSSTVQDLFDFLKAYFTGCP